MAAVQHGRDCRFHDVSFSQKAVTIQYFLSFALSLLDFVAEIAHRAGDTAVTGASTPPVEGGDKTGLWSGARMAGTVRLTGWRAFRGLPV